MQSLPYIWDSWYRYDELQKLFHVYYLNVDDHSLVATEQHHFSAKVGYATTKDFKHYDYVNHSILQADSNSRDNTSIWTGSVIEFGKSAKKLMAFTSRDNKQNLVAGFEAQPYNQHLSFAISDDNEHFVRLSGEHIDPDPRFYNTETMTNDVTIHAWRDPYIFRIPNDPYAYMLVTAQAKSLKNGFKGKFTGEHGVIALLRSNAPYGLKNWHSTGISFACNVSEAEVPRLYYDTQAKNHLIAYSCKNPATYLEDKINAACGFYGFKVDLGLIQHLLSHKDPSEHYIINIAHDLQIPLISFGEEPLYACQIIPELDGLIMGFDIVQGSLRLSAKKLAHLQPAQGDFNQFDLI
jgi:beta-fructofuranosidase